MASTPLARRIAALGILAGAMLLVAFGAAATMDAYMEGHREIVSKRAQLRGLRELAEARTAFEHLAPRKSGPSLILPADADASAALRSAVARAADGQQVIVDGVDDLPPDPVSRPATVHLRCTQAGLYGFLRTIEQQSPYMTVPRLEVTASRSADPEHGKPFVVSADLRLAALVAPALPARRRAPPAEPAETVQP